MIEQYNPDVAPEPQKWLALDEGERHLLVEQFHRDARIPLPKSARRVHAIIHATVETQLALEDQVVVRETLHRLMQQGLTRHEAVHAIGSILAEQMYDILHETKTDDIDPNLAYYAALQELTADKWRRGM